MTRPVAGFPTSFGNKVASVLRVTGPSVYTQYTAPSTGGQDVDTPQTFGVKNVNFAIGSVSQDGTHRAEVVQIERLAASNGVTKGTRLVLKWYVLATGAEAAASADLDAQEADILVLGDN